MEQKRIIINIVDDKKGIFYSEVEGKVKLTKIAKKKLYEHIDNTMSTLIEVYSK